MTVLITQFLTATTTIRTIAMLTSLHVPHSNTFLNYIFQGIYTIEVLVLKRFIPSQTSKLLTLEETGKNVSVKYVLVIIIWNYKL